jgi:calcium uptake protein 1, mitochondrial
MSLEQRRRHFFKYEKRIRELSSPEKVFEYFATIGDTNKGFTMTPSDIMRSVVPVYPPHDSDIIRAGSLPGEPSPGVPQHASQFFETFDVDNSGGISFDEWLLFDVLLSIPEAEVDGKQFSRGVFSRKIKII